jgi:hypothetical protein
VIRETGRKFVFRMLMRRAANHERAIDSERGKALHERPHRCRGTLFANLRRHAGYADLISEKVCAPLWRASIPSDFSEARKMRAQR